MAHLPWYGLVMKTCTRCQEDKDLAEFSRKATAPDGMDPNCRACKAELNAAYRASHAYKDTRSYSDRKERYTSGKARLWELKSNPCTDCGGTFHPAAMQFDHLPGSEKLFHLTTSSFASRSMDAVLAEVAKCELVCANCHAIRTWQRQQG